MAVSRQCVGVFRQCLLNSKVKLSNITFGIGGPQCYANRPYSSGNAGRPIFIKAAAWIGCLGIGGGIYGYLSAAPDRKQSLSNPMTQSTYLEMHAKVPAIKPSREVFGPATNFRLELTLYQYQTCPFCCKVRAFLDYHGISYKVIEVNPVMRQQIKFSKYKKVPILIAQEKGSNVQYQLNDSSVIISILGTLMTNGEKDLSNILQYYAPHTYENDEGKEFEEVMNKYFIMFGEKSILQTTDNIGKESQWRKWADNELVHILSPNIYRTYEEALQAFKYFSLVGEWEKNFSALERMVVIYVGATAMYFVGKRLKKKYSLKEDVRDSLYDACKLWTKEIKRGHKFMGGETINLADLAVYGLLNSIEGCFTFKDLLNHTNIGPWYYSVKEVVENHQGYNLPS